MNDTYLTTARLLVEIAPVVFESGNFALKGGTAINLFIREMPRLSVDLDLVFTDHRPSRPEALTAINEALRTARDRLTSRGLKVHALSAGDMGETRLLVQRDAVTVTVEVNTVIRGTVYPTQAMGLSQAASDALMADLDLTLLSADEIYGGKLVAAMDRPAALDANERQFLRTLVRAEPDWSLLDIAHLQDLPAIRWRIQNLQEFSRKSPESFRALADSLDMKYSKLD